MGRGEAKKGSGEGGGGEGYTAGDQAAGRYVPWIVVVHLVHRRSVVATEGAVARLHLARDWVGHGPVAVLVVDDDLDWPRARGQVWK